MQGLESLAFGDRLWQRIGRCMIGLALFGIGISLQMNANLGSPPWDVFHQGVSNQSGISIGRIIIITGFALLLLWIPLRQRPGIGTILNAFVIGLVADVALNVIAEPSNLLPRIAMVAVGIVTVAIGSGLYIGSALGPGPRDGIMTGLAEHGISIRLARTLIEVVVLATGWFLGGSVGVATLAFAFGVGPLVQFFLPHLAVKALANND